MITRYSLRIQRLFSKSPLIVSHQVHLAHLSPSTSYIEGTAFFTDKSRLAIFEFLRLTEGKVRCEKYRYQYMNEKGGLIFRYDNAPHHPEVKTFPHHKHAHRKTFASKAQSLSKILEEIQKNILDLPREHR